MIGAREESGPSTRIRDGPTIAYTRSGTIVAYRPVIAGSPEASAYPIPTGTRNAANTRPAIVSRASHSRRYERSVDSPGTNRMIGGVTASVRTDRRSTPSAWLRRSSSRRDEVPPRSQFQVPLMDDRVPLRRRHLQLGLRLLDKRPLPGAGNLRPRKTPLAYRFSHMASPGWRPASSSTPPPQTDGLQTCAWAREASVWDGSTAGSVAFQRRSSCLPLPTPLDPPTRLLVRRPDGRREALGFEEAHNHLVRSGRLNF